MIFRAISGSRTRSARAFAMIPMKPATARRSSSSACRCEYRKRNRHSTTKIKKGVQMKKLKTDGPPLRSFDQIQKEIRAEQGTIRNLGGTVETASKEQAEAGQIRDDTAYPALA